MTIAGTKISAGPQLMKKEMLKQCICLAKGSIHSIFLLNARLQWTLQDVNATSWTSPPKAKSTEGLVHFGNKIEKENGRNYNVKLVAPCDL